MNLKRIAMLGAVCMLVSITAGAQETELAASETEITAAELNTGAAEMSDDWKDYQIMLDGQVYSIPMMYSDFVAYGWESKGDPSEQLEPYQYDMMRFEKGNETCTAYIINLGKNTMAAEDCIMGGISMDTFNWDLETGSVVLPGGIVRGTATLEDIEAAYGKPSDTYDGELYTEVTYETDSYSKIEMKVYKESGVLEEISMRNFVEPEGFEAGEISEEVPESVLSYQKPDALGDDLTEYRMAIDGEIYALPVPVAVLIADGWELDEKDSDSEISSGNFGWVTLRKGGQEIREIAVNEEAYATIPQNCWVEELEAGNYKLDAEGEIPCGIHTGMSEEEFLKALETSGAEYELNESGDYHYYTISAKRYNQCYEAVIFKGENSSYETDTLIGLTCSNAF